MTVVSTLEPAEKPQQPNRLSPEPALPDRVRPFWRAQALDGLLIVLFLGLTFLLGAFPLKDADIYWHLRTGDLIRQTGKVPQTDIFTFTREGTPWIDLHWIFQIGVSWLFERGGVRGTQRGQVRPHVRCDAHFAVGAETRVVNPGHGAGLAARATGAGRPDLCSPRDPHALVPFDLRGRDLPLGSISPARVPASRGSNRLGQFAGAIRAWPGDPGFRAHRRGATAGNLRLRSQRVVEADLDCERLHWAGLPGQPLWNQRGPLSDRAGRDDEQPDLFAQRRRADAHSGLHRAVEGPGDQQPSVDASPARTGDRWSELLATTLLADQDLAGR